MKRILWIARREVAPLPSQQQRLREMFGGDCEIVRQDIGNGAEIANEFRAGRYDDIICVVPLATLRFICEEGIKPLYSQMAEAGQGRPDITVRGMAMWFAGFRRVTGVSLELVEPEPLPGVRRVLRCTRHDTYLAQEMVALRMLYGANVEVTTDLRLFRDGREVQDWMRAAGAQDVLVVAPYGVIDQLVKSGRKPLWVEIAGGRFRKLWRVQGVRIDFEQ